MNEPTIAETEPDVDPGYEQEAVPEYVEAIEDDDDDDDPEPPGSEADEPASETPDPDEDPGGLDLSDIDEGHDED